MYCILGLVTSFRIQNIIITSLLFQIIWQVAGLSFLWYIGSPQSKEGDERKEEKMDLIIKMLDPKNARIILKDLETKYPKK